MRNDSKKHEEDIKPADFVKLILHPEQLSKQAGVKLTLLARRDWWENIKPSKDKPFSIRLSENDLRIRHRPCEHSELVVLGHKHELNHDADNLSIKINALIKIRRHKPVTTSGGVEVIEADMLGGFLRFERLFDSFLQNNFSWLWDEIDQSGQEKFSLIFGRNKMHLEKRETAQSYRYEYIRPTQKGLLWQMVTCQDVRFATPASYLVDLQHKIADFAASIVDGDTRLFSVQPYPEEAGVYIEVKVKNNQALKEQFLKPGVQVTIRQENAGGGRGAESIWQPGTVKELGDENNRAYQLLDYNEVDTLLETGNTMSDLNDTDFTITWQSDGDKVHRIIDKDIMPDLYLVGADKKSVVHDDMLWQVVRKDDDKAPLRWMRYQLSELSLNNHAGSKKRINSLSQSKFLFFSMPSLHPDENEPNDWRLAVDLLQLRGLDDKKMRMRLTLSDKKAVLELVKPQLKMISPEFSFYNGVLNDAASMPADRDFVNHLTLSRLVFENDLHVQQSDENEYRQQAIAAKVTKAGLAGSDAVNIVSIADKVTLYNATATAIVDAKTPANGNIIQREASGQVVHQQQATLTASLASSGKTINLTLSDFAKHGEFAGFMLSCFDASNHQLALRIVSRQDNQFVVEKPKTTTDDEALLTQLLATVRVELTLLTYAEPRDMAHGYVGATVHDFLLSKTPSNETLLHINRYSKHDIVAIEALLPWAEYKENAQGNVTRDLYHRHLILDHIEFATGADLLRSFSDEMIRANRETMRQAVRDRFTLMAKNVSNVNDAKLENWLPGATLSFNGADFTTQSGYPSLNYYSGTDIPRIDLSVSRSALGRSLSIADGDKQWFTYDVRLDAVDSMGKPRFSLTNPLAKEDKAADVLCAKEAAMPLVMLTDSSSQDNDKFYDNLGVVRPCLAKPNTDSLYNEWFIEENHIDGIPYLSISVAGAQLYDNVASHSNNASQLLFSCDGLKVPLEHNEQSKELDPGAYGFFSKITSAVDSLKTVDKWPRFNGIPFYVVAMPEFVVMPNVAGGYVPKKMLLRVVFADVAELFENPVEKTSTDIPAFVRRAVAKRQVAILEYQFADEKKAAELKLLNSNQPTLHWMFPSVSKKVKYLDNANVARLESHIVAGFNAEEASGLQVKVSSKGSFASVFSRLWPVDANDLSLQSLATFEKKADQWYQTSLTFSSVGAFSPGDDFFKLHLAKDDDELLSYKLSTILSSATTEPLKADISPGQHLRLYLHDDGKTHAMKLKITQGIYYGFVVDNKAIVENALSEKLLILWVENVEGKHKLARFVIKDFRANRSLTLASANAPDNKMTLSGEQVGLRVYYHLDKEIKDGEPPAPWQQIDLATWRLQQEGALNAETMIVRFDDQLLFNGYRGEVQPPRLMTGYLQLNQQASEVNAGTKTIIQAPIRLMVAGKEAAAEATFATQSFYAKNVAVASGRKLEDVQADVRLPIDTDKNLASYFQETTLVDPNTCSKDCDKAGYMQVSFTGERFVYQAINKDLVPLDRCLESGSIVATQKVSLSMPQLIHRQIYGSSLRMALPDTDYLAGVSGKGAIKPLTDLSGNWLLNPMVKDVAGRPLLMDDNLFLSEREEVSAQKNMQTENVLVFSRPSSKMGSEMTLPFSGLANTTMSLHADTGKKSQFAFTDSSVKDMVLDAGASGVIVHRVINQKGVALYEFLRSPFYEQSHSSVALNEQPAQISVASSSGQGRIDERVLHPLVTASIKAIDDKILYKLSSAGDVQGYEDRQVCFALQNTTQTRDLQQQVNLYFFETPAFEQQRPLFRLPKNAQPETGLPHHFVPPQLKVRYGRDKSGAMLRHLMRAARATASSQPLQQSSLSAWQLSPRIEYALRDLQNIDQPKGTRQAIRDVSLTTQDTVIPHTKVMTAAWKELLAEIAIQQLKTVVSIRSRGPVDEKKMRYRFNPGRPLLQCMVSHSFNMREVASNDSAIMAYQYPDGDNMVTWWTDIYMAIRHDNLTALKKAVRYREERKNAENKPVKFMTTFNLQPYLLLGKAEVQHVAGTEQFKYDPNTLTLKQGDIVQLTGLKAARLTANDSAWQVATVLAEQGLFTLENIDSSKVDEIVLPDKAEILILKDLPTSAVLHSSINDDYHLWKINLQDYPLRDKGRCFQLVWSACAKPRRVNENENQEVNISQHYSAYCNYYAVDKIVKTVPPESGKPKIAAVLALRDQSRAVKMHKTIFFGDAAAAKNATVALHEDGEDKDLYVRTLVSDDESVVVTCPGDAGLQNELYIVKYLPNGQVFYQKTRA